VITLPVQADSSLWTDSSKAETIQTATVSSTKNLESFRWLILNEARLNQALAIKQESASANLKLSLPLPDGHLVEVELVPEQVLAAESVKQSSELKAWSVLSKDDRVVGGVVDQTPLGLHAMLELTTGETVFIDPVETEQGRRYVSFMRQANPKAFRAALSNFRCGNHDEPSKVLEEKILEQADAVVAHNANRLRGKTLNTYRLALGTTAEFTQTNGGKAATKARLFVLVSRINRIYLRDLSIKFTWVGADKLIQTDLGDVSPGDGLADGYSNDDDSGVVIFEQNKAILDRELGKNSYDVGHVLTTGGIGYGQYYTPCSTEKAYGTSAIPEPLANSPAINVAAIDMVGHELGHQFGAAHTFNANTGGACATVNGSPTRSDEGAVEPGSGTTIMAYEGLCEHNNILPLHTNGNLTDAMFHAHSIQQITAFGHNGDGNTCPSHTALINPKTGTTNKNPVIAMPAAITIPARTAFTLPKVTVKDSDGDTLSYAWDQVNVGGTAADKNHDTGDAALIRSRVPRFVQSTRNIPVMRDLLAGNSVDGEYLPITNRSLKFRLVARDNVGGQSMANYNVKVIDTGAAFSVPETTLLAGQSTVIRWNVAGTNTAPINCTQVDINLMSGKGIQYANLGRYTNNGSSPTLSLPSTILANSRVKVSCSNNSFFAISGANPAVAAP
jgi:hypothetical protein